MDSSNKFSPVLQAVNINVQKEPMSSVKIIMSPSSSLVKSERKKENMCENIKNSSVHFRRHEYNVTNLVDQTIMFKLYESPEIGETVFNFNKASSTPCGGAQVNSEGDSSQDLEDSTYKSFKYSPQDITRFYTPIQHRSETNGVLETEQNALSNKEICTPRKLPKTYSEFSNDEYLFVQNSSDLDTNSSSEIEEEFKKPSMYAEFFENWRHLSTILETGEESLNLSETSNESEVISNFVSSEEYSETSTEIFNTSEINVNEQERSIFVQSSENKNSKNEILEKFLTEVNLSEKFAEFIKKRDNAPLNIVSLFRYLSSIINHLQKGNLKLEENFSKIQEKEEEIRRHLETIVLEIEKVLKN